MVITILIHIEWRPVVAVAQSELDTDIYGARPSRVAVEPKPPAINANERRRTVTKHVYVYETAIGNVIAAAKCDIGYYWRSNDLRIMETLLSIVT